MGYQVILGARLRLDQLSETLRNSSIGRRGLISSVHGARGVRALRRLADAGQGSFPDVQLRDSPAVSTSAQNRPVFWGLKSLNNA